MGPPLLLPAAHPRIVRQRPPCSFQAMALQNETCSIQSGETYVHPPDVLPRSVKVNGNRVTTLCTYWIIQTAREIPVCRVQNIT